MTLPAARGAIVPRPLTRFGRRCEYRLKIAAALCRARRSRDGLGGEQQMPRKIKGYGWTPDMPDGRDLLYAAPVEALEALPRRVDLRKQCPDVYDQGQLGSCTANAIGGALEFDQMKQNQNAFTPSRLFIYYNERVMEGTVNSDSGAMLRDGMKTVARQGACPEPMWPYLINKFKT